MASSIKKSVFRIEAVLTISLLPNFILNHATKGMKAIEPPDKHKSNVPVTVFEICNCACNSGKRATQELPIKPAAKKMSAAAIRFCQSVFGGAI